MGVELTDIFNSAINNSLFKNKGVSEIRGFRGSREILGVCLYPLYKCFK